MTKADRIRQLAKRKKTDAEIVRIITREFGFCAPSYVRVCARQRVNGEQSISDLRYASSPHARALNNQRSHERYHKQPEWMAYYRAYYRERSRSGSLERARRAANAAKREVLASHA